MSGEILGSINRAKISLFKRWVVNPQITILPKNISFGEVHAALDELEERIDEVRKTYLDPSEEGDTKPKEENG